MIKINDIKINHGRRKIDEKKVLELSESIKQLGLLNPITINKDNTLIAGNHRVEACKLLGWDEIQVNIIDLSGLLAELAEIDENLIRNELHWLEIDKQLARRKEIYGELHPETKHNAKFKGNQFRSNGIIPSEQKTFTEDTANKLGQSQSNVQKSVARGEKIINEIEEDIKELDITKTEGTILSRQDADKQKKIIETKKENKDASIKEIIGIINKEEKEKEKTERAKQINLQEFEKVENIFLGSCIDHIKTLNDKSIDCVVTDPPYGVDFQMNAYNNELSRKIANDKSLEDALILLSKTLDAIKPKMKDDGQLYIFCSWQIYPSFSEVVLRYFDIHNLIIWNKMIMGMGDLKSNFGGMYEMIIFAGFKRTFATRPANIINCRFNEERFHNTQKPVELIKTILNISTNNGDFIYDPFLGSGSTAIAAKELKRNYGGAEIDEQNYKITLKRLSDVVL